MAGQNPPYKENGRREDACLFVKALVVRAGSLGDLIVTLPVVRTLRRNGYQVTLAGRGIWVDYLKRSGCVDEASALDGTVWLSFFTADSAVPEEIVQALNGYDLIIAYQSENEIFAGNLKRVTRSTLLFHPAPGPNLDCHITEYLLQPLKDRFRTLETVPEIPLPSRRKHYALIHPGSGSQTKNWPKENFLEVYRTLVQASPVKILLGPAETYQALFWKSNLPAEDLMVSADFDRLTEILAETLQFIGNDSGITHLAAGAGVPVVAIFGPTDPTIWGPRGRNVRIVFKDIGCNPCPEQTRAACRHRRCLLELTPEHILNS